MFSINRNRPEDSEELQFHCYNDRNLKKLEIVKRIYLQAELDFSFKNKFQIDSNAIPLSFAIESQNSDKLLIKKRKNVSKTPNPKLIIKQAQKRFESGKMSEGMNLEYDILFKKLRKEYLELRFPFEME